MILTTVQGQARAQTALSGFLASAQLPPALLFHGLEGIGKTLAAFEFASALVCRARGEGATPACGLCPDCEASRRGGHPDLTRVNAAYQASLREEEPAKQRSLRVETIRHLRRDMEMVSLLGGWKVAVIEEAHTLEIEAANALLKILEEPLPKVLWILVTPWRERLPKTVLSRCRAVTFAPLPPATVRRLLEARGVAAADAARLAQFCEGSVSRALELSASGYPESLRGGALAPLAAADSLPRELYLARTQVELALFALAQDLRLRQLDGRLPLERAARPLRELVGLRQALRSNADPKTVLILACLESEKALA